MRNLCFIIFIVFTSCKSINQSRKSAGISRQSLYSTIKTINNEEKMLPTLFWAHYDATQRGGIYLVNPDGKVKVISENPPDAVLNSSIEILAKSKVGDKVDAGLKLSAIKSIAELGKRNSANYMIRDLAFRLEALKNNNDSIDPEIIRIYEKLIESSERITIAESKFQIQKSKEETLKELLNIIKISKDTAYSDLKIDSTFFKKLGDYLEMEK